MKGYEVNIKVALGINAESKQEAEWQAQRLMEIIESNLEMPFSYEVEQVE